MRFFQSLFAGAALVVAALAVEINDFPREVQVGRSYVIKYTPGDSSPTTFILRKGANENLDTIGTLTTSATGGSFTWSVASNLPNGDDYALEVKQGSTNNYIGPIRVSGSSYSASSIASSATSTPASSASSAASSSAVTTNAPSTLTTATSASASVSVSSASTNGTVSSATLSRTGSGTSAPTSTGSGSGTPTGGVPESTGAASSLASSPLALIFGAVAAMAYLN